MVSIVVSTLHCTVYPYCNYRWQLSQKIAVELEAGQRPMVMIRKMVIMIMVMQMKMIIMTVTMRQMTPDIVIRVPGG